MLLTKSEREVLHNHIMFCSIVANDTKHHGIQMTMTTQRVEELATAVQATVISKSDLEAIVTVLGWLVLHNLWEVASMAQRPKNKAYNPADDFQHFANLRGRLLDKLGEQGRLLGLMLSVQKAVAGAEVGE